VHHQREPGQAPLDFLQHIEVETLGSGELERTMTGPDGAREAIATAALDELPGLAGIGELGVGFADRHVFFHAAELSELGLDRDPASVGRVHDPAGDGDVRVQILVARINHHGAVETALDAIHARFLVTVVQVHGEDGLRKDLVSTPDQAFEHHLVRVRPGPLADLDDEGSLAIEVATEQPHALLEVVDVVGADGELAVGDIEQVFGGDDHDWIFLSGGSSRVSADPAGGQRGTVHTGQRRRMARSRGYSGECCWTRPVVS
jgi:hypothetical protein